jgi:Ca2+-binding EF-hand superfamily protein
LGRVTFQEFSDGCKGHGWDVTDEQVKDMFVFLDVQNSGSIAIEDVAFLDKDPKRREGALRKAQLRAQIEQQNYLTSIFKAERGQKSSSKAKPHRYSVRPWHRPLYDALPAIVLEKRNQDNSKQRKRLEEAKEAFLYHIERAFGTRIRAWRKGLDPKGTFAVTRSGLGRFCRHSNLDVDLHVLWKALTQEGETLLRVEDVTSKAAAALAEFRSWAHERFGSCADVWGAVKEVAKPSMDWRSDKVFRANVVLKAFKALEWPGAQQAGTPAIICQAFDVTGANLISAEDLRWFDKWSPPVWLSAAPDPRTLASIRSLFLSEHGKPLRAWRSMDADDTNQVSWTEFRNECARLHFNGNIAGAWRALDQEPCGNISLEQFDEPSCDLLTSFKMWLDDSFGSVEFAFRSWDTDGSGALTLSEMKRGCRRGGWDGDVKTIFESLDLDYSQTGNKSIAFTDLAFLDSWVINAGKKKPARPRAYQDALRSIAASPGRQEIQRDKQAAQASEMKNSRAQSCPALPPARDERLQLPHVNGDDSVSRTEPLSLPPVVLSPVNRNNLLAWHTKKKAADM